MEFMDHLCQFGQFGILTFRDGIQEVSGLVLLVFTFSEPSPLRSIACCIRVECTLFPCQ